MKGTAAGDSVVGAASVAEPIAALVNEDGGAEEENEARMGVGRRP